LIVSAEKGPVAELALASLTGIGVVLVLLMSLCQRRGLHRLPPQAGRTPPVSVLKPLCGVDQDLASNLRSFYHLEYPSYELIFGAQDPDDPAVSIARAFACEHPEVPTTVIVSTHRVGHNPKVNNLANMLPAARHELILISDSNVAVDASYLRSMVDHLDQPNVGLVTSLIRGAHGSGLGGMLEAVQLNTFVMGGVAAVSDLFGRVCSVGKSMLFRRSDLERIGGFAMLSRYLAEDQICGEALRALGYRVVVAAPPITNVLGHLSVRRFAARHLRWARIRRRISPLGYAAEVLANPLVPASVHLAVPPGLLSACLAVSALLAMSVVAMLCERGLGVRRHPLIYPCVEAIRGILIALMWPVPFLSSTVGWRGQRFRIGARTLLQPVDSDVY
jgi:ceramide glucosyltransferase